MKDAFKILQKVESRVVLMSWRFLKSAPLYFVRSGYITLPIAAGTFRDAGIAGLYWSSRSYSMSTRAYNLLFNANEVNSLRNDYARWYAFPSAA